MPKQGEIDYLRRLGEDGTLSSFNKPFSEDTCGKALMDLGAIISLLPQPPSRLLDLGVGTGWTSIFFGKRGYDVVGQDISEDMIKLANLNKARYQTENIEFMVSDYESMNFQSEFDCAVFYDALHHAENEEAALRAVFQALRPGGVCVTIEPGEGHCTSTQSIEAARLYGVTERDMPPALIIARAQKIGFGGVKVFQRYNQVVQIPDLAFQENAFWRWFRLNLEALKGLPPLSGWRRRRRFLRRARTTSHIVVLIK
jgi:SAM-dependent methyltransferase